MEKPFIDKPEGPAPADLVIEDITVGDGAEAVAGGFVKVHYLGVDFETGEEFDSSWDRGQSARFPLPQLIGAWQQGNRRAVAPDCMAEIAHRLRPEEVTASAAWLASQSMPADTRPAAGFTRPLPMRCGSVGDVAGDQR